MKKNKISIKNILFLVLLLVLIIPQTRRPIQVFIHKGLALFSPSVTDTEERLKISSYDWKLQDINGNALVFESLKDKPILINLWATWCPPCIAEMPGLQALYDDCQDKINFVFISNETREVVYEFLAQNGYSFTSFMSKSQAPATFDSRSIPRTLLIDKSGYIIIDKKGAANWNSDSVRETIETLLRL